MEPTVGRIVHYRLTRLDAKAANLRRQESATHFAEHHAKANGTLFSQGNQHAAGDVVPFLIVRVWPNEYTFSTGICRDYLPGDEDPTWDHPLSAFGVNGQAFLDGNDTLWITSAPQGDFNGGWNWPPRWNWLTITGTRVNSAVQGYVN